MTLKRNESSSIEQLRERLTAVLATHGFKETGPTLFIEARGFDRWSRATEWKREVFEIDYPKPGPTTIGAKVFVKILVGGGREVTADVASVGFLSNRPSEYQVHGVSANESSTLVEDVEHALRWLELYASPAKALERMHTATRNGCGKGTAPYEEAVALLTTLQAH